MSQQTYRVVARDSAGEWYQVMEGLRHECRAHIHKMAKRKRAKLTPIVTRRTLEGWKEKIDV